MILIKNDFPFWFIAMNWSTPKMWIWLHSKILPLGTLIWTISQNIQLTKYSEQPLCVQLLNVLEDVGPSTNPQGAYCQIGEATSKRRCNYKVKWKWIFFFLSTKQTLSGTITDKEDMDYLRESLKASLTKLECVQKSKKMSKK